MAKLVIELVSTKEKKMKRLIMILVMGLSCMSNASYAGNGDLTVGGTLEMTSSANGFLPPRMSTSARGNFTPSPGMLIYNTDDNAYNYYTSSGWKILAATLPVHDNTGASSDYALAVGETAKITYSSATSVPLHIATTQGEYEVTILGTTSSSISNYGGIMLNPNNTTYANSMYLGYWVTVGSGGLGNSVVTNYANIQLTEGSVIRAVAKISTFTVCKQCFTQYSCYVSNSTSGLVRSNRETLWNDTTTLWTSLGTITFPFAQSGTIIIRRLL